MVAEIRIEFRLLGRREWSEITVSPQEYFDEEEDPNDIDSVPRHNHAIDYLTTARACRDVEATRLEMLDRARGKSRVITETFWNHGENRVIERKDIIDGKCDYWELILDVLVSEMPYVSETIRIGRNDDLPEVLSHVLIERQPDGSERESIIHTWSGREEVP